MDTEEEFDYGEEDKINPESNNKESKISSEIISAIEKGKSKTENQDEEKESDLYYNKDME